MTIYKRIDGDYRIVSVNNGDSIILESDDVSITGNLAVDGTIALGSLTVDELSLGNLTASGNVSAARLIGSLVTGAQPNITSLGTLSSLAVSGGITGNLTTSYQPNVTLLGTLVGLVVDGNAVVTGNATAGFFLGDGRYLTNVVANVGAASSVQNGTSSVGIPGTNGEILIQVSGVANTVIFGASSTTFGTVLDAPSIVTNTIRSDDSTAVTIEDSMTVDGALTVVGSLSAGSLAFENISVPGNVSAGQFVLGGNVVGINLAGNLLTANQPFITQLGNLVSLVVTGNLNAGNISTTDITGTIVTASQPNITSVGTLASLDIAGNAIASGNIIGGNLVTAGNIVAGNLIVAGIEAVTTLNVTGDTTIVGNLTVQGTTITANVATLVVTDPILGLGRGANGDPLTSNDGLDRGIEMFYYTTAEQIAFIGYDNNEGKILSASNVSVANNIVTVNSYGTTVVGTLEGTSVDVTGNVVGGNLITNGLVSLASIAKTGSNGVGNIGSISNQFDTIFAKATSAQYADLAELYLADSAYLPGTVMLFGGNREITRSESIDSHRVVGVVSHQPAYIMNAGLNGEFVTTVALIGRVPCYVRGPVEPGDLLVSDLGGWARVNNTALAGHIIGKSLTASSQDALIEIVVGQH